MGKMPSTVPYERFVEVLNRAKQAEEALETLRREQLADRAAQLTGLPLELASRLVGTTQDDLIQDAKRFLSELQGR